MAATLINSPQLFSSSSRRSYLPSGLSGVVTCQQVSAAKSPIFTKNVPSGLNTRNRFSRIPRSSGSSSSDGNLEDPKALAEKGKVPFGYSRKDVLLIGVGVTAAGFGLESGLEFVGVDPLQVGNVVQLVLVLGLTLGWISTYMFRVSNKDMTYAQQLRDYESKVMEVRGSHGSRAGSASGASRGG